MSDQQPPVPAGGQNVPSEWQQTEVAGLRVDVRRSAGHAPGTPVVIHLHDVEGPAVIGDAVLADALDQHNVTLICPDSSSCWWTAQICPDFPGTLPPLEYLRSELVPWIEEQFSVSPPHIGLLGLGSGGQGVLQLAYRRAREFPAVAALTPAVDFHRLHGAGTVLDRMFPDPEAARQQTATLWLHPLNWPRHQLLLSDRESPWFEGAERLAMKLSSSGILFESDFALEAGGDLLAAFHHQLPLALGFLTERLELESRRLA